MTRDWTTVAIVVAVIAALAVAVYLYADGDFFEATSTEQPVSNR